MAEFDPKYEIALPPRRQRDAPELGSGRGRMAIVLPGQEIVADAGSMRGHGTYAGPGERTVASAAGVEERVAKLVTARPVRSRYREEVGDVVVGRVTAIESNQWVVDIGAARHAGLLLAAVQFPGLVQRIRTREDELNMRAFLAEGDLVSAEVQSVHASGACSLHTRSMRYGKLRAGVLVAVPSALVKRCKSHFGSLNGGVSFIIGVNGYCWVYPTAMNEWNAQNAMKEIGTEAPLPLFDHAVRRSIARVRNAFCVLANHGVAIYTDTLVAVCETAEQMEIEPAEMLTPANSERLAERARLLSQY